MQCSIHQDRKAVLSSGYDYCLECSRERDRAEIVEWIKDYVGHQPSREKIRLMLCDVFLDEDYSFHNFPLLYDRYPRGPWIEKEKRFEIPIKTYILNVFGRWYEAGRK